MALTRAIDSSHMGAGQKPLYKKGQSLLRLFNTLGKKQEVFRPVHKDRVSMFTCGPSVYQRSHIGNFRTFLFEDILVRYLEYAGYTVKRGMNFTDVEDKAIQEAKRKKTTLKALTEENIAAFIQEMALLRMRIPDALPRASEAVDTAADIIDKLLNRGIAYWHKGNVYFDPLQYPQFGELFGLDMHAWPSEKRRFHKDTYLGMRWNRGDFILWHGNAGKGEVSWNTKIGRGRPSWNIQDPSMIAHYRNETLSIYCGGIDNLVRHHDYSRAILESIRPYPMARFWLHCNHLFVNGRKMSKSTGNVLYTDTLLDQGYGIDEIRFFLIYGHYRKNLNYTQKKMSIAAKRLTMFKKMVKTIQEVVVHHNGDADKGTFEKTREVFLKSMDNDLHVKGAFDGLYGLVSGVDSNHITPPQGAGMIKALKEIDTVLAVIF